MPPVRVKKSRGAVCPAGGQAARPGMLPGGSSELLLDAKCRQMLRDELDRRKALENGPYGRRKRQQQEKQQAGRTCRQRLAFYATSSLALVAITGGCALLFLVPLYVDPAVSTLVADFFPEPVLCTTSKREDLWGLFNCTWSSCREGCTSEVYRCTHIYVTYSPWTNVTSNNDFLDNGASGGASGGGGGGGGGDNGATNELTRIDDKGGTNCSDDYGDISHSGGGGGGGGGVNKKKSTPSSSSSSSGTTTYEQAEIIQAVLLVNIKGCGYPPVVDCENFTRELGYAGSQFPCYYSRVNGSIVMADYNRDAEVTIIMHYFAIPLVMTLTTTAVLCVWHCDCRFEPLPPRRYHNHHHHHHNQKHGTTTSASTTMSVIDGAGASGRLPKSNTMMTTTTTTATTSARPNDLRYWWLCFYVSECKYEGGFRFLPEKD